MAPSRWLSTLAFSAFGVAAAMVHAQSPGCTTQARLSAPDRQAVGEAAFGLASAVQGNDAGRVRSLAVPAALSDPAQLNGLIQSTAPHLSRDSLRVTQAYVLDAGTRAASDKGPAEFSCALAKSVAETDFAIPGLPSGRFAFVVVEAHGPDPWQLSFLLQQSGNAWRMAGFYPHATTAAGHDGLWYWTTARTDAKQDKPWLAWLLYGEADNLLRPVNFLTSTNLEKLRSEQRGSAPQNLVNGISAESPFNLQGAGGVYRVTELSTRAAEDGKSLELSMHLEGQAAVAQTETAERNLRAAQALVSAHPELRSAFSAVEVVSEVPGQTPVVLERPMAQLSSVPATQ